MSWGRLFTPRVLDQGFDYWLDGSVGHISNQGDEYSAIVEGMQDYSVVIANLLAVYEQIVRNMARPASSRAGYQVIVDVLRKMLDFDGGKPLVKGLLEEWRFTYGNRPAMQDELKKVFIRQF